MLSVYLLFGEITRSHGRKYLSLASTKIHSSNNLYFGKHLFMQGIGIGNIIVIHMDVVLLCELAVYQKDKL